MLGKIKPKVSKGQMAPLDYGKWGAGLGDVWLYRRKAPNQKVLSKFCEAVINLNNIIWEINHEEGNK